MTWTYTPGWLSSASATTSNMIGVRRMVGDVDTRVQKVQDEEIYWILSQSESQTYAAAAVCDLLAAEYAFLCNTENSELRISAAARHKHFLALADRLRAQGPGAIPGGDGDGITLSEIYVGGAVVADVETLSDNDSYQEPPFAVGQDDFPGTANDVDRGG
jgi:hypothetical protein